jgi:heavy metal sensor kinase
MRSLRLKLIVGSLLVLAAVILSFDVFIYIARRKALLDILDGRLFAESQSVALRLEIAGGKPAFDPAEDKGAGPAISSIFRIIDENGMIVFQSPLSTDLTWPSVSKDAVTPYWTTTHSARGEAWRAATWVNRIEIDAESGEKNAARPETTIAVTIQCVESLAVTNKELRELTSLLAVLSLAAFLIAGGGSFLLAGRALRPIRRINKALAGVSETRLDRRIDPEGFDTELYPLIEQLNAALDRLEKGFQRERQFTADASHELRTPVAAILNTIEVLLRRPRSDQELIEAHHDNWRSARSMQAVIEGLLLLSRMDAGKAHPAKEEIPLAALVEEIFAAIGPEAKAGTVRLGQGIDPRLRVLADPSQIRLALSNLIDNAVRYNRPNGSVTVDARTADGGTEIEVRDTGIGISAEHLPRIFERFYRVDPSRTEATGGSGLGLSIVRKIIEAHGGRVTATSGPEGSVVTVFLPGL